MPLYQEGTLSFTIAAAAASIRNTRSKANKKSRSIKNWVVLQLNPAGPGGAAFIIKRRLSETLVVKAVFVFTVVIVDTQRLLLLLFSEASVAPVKDKFEPLLPTVAGRPSQL